MRMRSMVVEFLLSSRSLPKCSSSKTNSNCARFGLIKRWAGKEVNFETPLCLIHTQAGHVPHLSHDLLSYAGISDTTNFIYQLTLPTLVQTMESLKQYGKGAKSFIGMQEECSVLLSINDPAVKDLPGYNNKNGISIHAPGGRHLIDCFALKSLISDCKVDSLQIMADTDLNVTNSTGKRLTKALDRSSRFLEQTLNLLENDGETDHDNLNLFGTVTGGFDELSRRQSCSFLNDHAENLSGFIIDNLPSHSCKSRPIKSNKNEQRDTTTTTTIKKDDNSSASCISNDDNNMMVEKFVEKFIGYLDPSKLRLCFGAYDPSQVYRLITTCGIDIFDTSYVCIITDQHKALKIDFESLPNFDQLFELIDISNNKLAQDYSKLVKDCDCYTCTKYTKAYLYHLNNTSELLEYVLLMIHNLYQYTKYFELIRSRLNSPL